MNGTLCCAGAVPGASGTPAVAAPQGLLGVAGAPVVLVRPGPPAAAVPEEVRR
ncbi:hypothetical protein [Streptomyces sp. NPDC093094]|uniref:hypothetical protein n=1 Tax=Streptomyces sp. NPDC093094 TaxID=3366026 RepID=UPI00380FB6EE